MRFILVLSVLCVVGLQAVGSEETGARLLAAKNILNQWLVEGRDLTVLYSIYNVGSSAALTVALTDETFPDSDFEVVTGQLAVLWDRIAPGSNVSHSVILRPLKSGFFNFTSATVSYFPNEGEDARAAYTSAPGEDQIVPFKDYDRQFSPHYMDWGAFAIMILPSVGIPFLLWYRSKSKYENAALKSKKH